MDSCRDAVEKEPPDERKMRLSSDKQLDASIRFLTRFERKTKLHGIIILLEEVNASIDSPNKKFGESSIFIFVSIDSVFLPNFVVLLCCFNLVFCTYHTSKSWNKILDPNQNHFDKFSFFAKWKF